MEYSESINPNTSANGNYRGIRALYKNMTIDDFYTTIDTLEEYIEELEKQVKSID